MTLRDQTEFNAVLRADLHAFVQLCFKELNPQTVFQETWHIELILAELEACRRGECKRLIINVPPRSLKSQLVSVAFPAWVLGHRPSAQIIAASYGQDLADRFARDCRTLMASAAYQELFPATRLSPHKQSVEAYMTTAQGWRIATSVGGRLTGLGADFILIDDPLKPDEALSETLRNKVNDWYDHSLYSRLNNKEEGVIIIIMQRLHLDDLVGHVLGQEKWKVVSLPAIAEVDETYAIQTPYTTYQHIRPAGTPLHPARESLATLQQIRQTLGEYNFAGQYQQNPVPRGGGLVKQDWFATYELHQRPQKFDRLIQSWDTASKESELSDFSVCTTWGIQDYQIYLLHLLRKRMDYPTLKRLVHEQHAVFKPDVILIEDKSSGTQLIQELKTEGVYAVQGVKPEGDKFMRLHAQTATIENGFVHLPKDAPWLAEYMLELTNFPKGKYDDQVDSTSQALAWIKAGMWRASMGLFMYYKREAERIRARE
jgi:predicted phage terminase large subunit-like protein